MKPANLPSRESIKRHVPDIGALYGMGPIGEQGAWVTLDNGREVDALLSEIYQEAHEVRLKYYGQMATGSLGIRTFIHRV